MAHHSNDPFSPRMMGQDSEIAKLFARERASGGGFFQSPAAEPELGPAGQFPQGKLTPEDEGEIRIGITTYNGVVVIDFGKPVAWMGMDPEQARAIGELLILRAGEIE